MDSLDKREVTTTQVLERLHIIRSEQQVVQAGEVKLGELLDEVSAQHQQL